MDNNSEISLGIIIPAYNVEKYILDCLESINSQYINGITVYVIDDCSTDNTYNILKEYSHNHPYVKLFHNNASMGASYSRNIGIKNNKCKYLMFLDGDDTLYQNAIFDLYYYLINNNCDLVCSNFEYVFENGKKKKSNINIYENVIYEGNSPKPISKFLDAAKEIIWQPWGKIYKTGIIINNNIFFNKKYIACNDFDFVFKYCMYVNRLGYLDERTVGYTYKRNDSITKRLSYKSVESNIESISGIYKIYNKEFEKSIYLKNINAKISKFLLIYILQRICYFNQNDQSKIIALLKRHGDVFEGLNGKSKAYYFACKIFGWNFMSKLYCKIINNEKNMMLV